MHGWKGKILRVNLSEGKYFVEDLPVDLARNFIGGRGLALKVLYDEIDPQVDPLSPANKLLFATGPLTGTGTPAGGRFVAVSKSPLTGGIANPCCGGYFGAMLKFAGYDLLIIEGKAEDPLYLVIEDDVVDIKSARHLWGKGAGETESLLRTEIKNNSDSWKANEASIAYIGPAGENLVRFACIMTDGGRALGRSGLGAVMGSKNLKAVVANGTGTVHIADVAGFKKAVMDLFDEAKKNKELYNRSMWGTWTLIGRANKTGTLATRNFQAGYFEEFAEFEDPASIRDSIRVRDEGCFGCPFRCSKRSRIADPQYTATAKGPEHETMALLGSNCGIGDLYDICRANYLCNEFGMDTITTGATISCAMELFERGHLPEKDIGYRLNFGNAKATLELIKKIAFRQDFGDLLAEGGYAVAERYGHTELFMGVKKQGMPAWHPQGWYPPGVGVIGLQYATSNAGASHTKSTLPFYKEISGFERLIEWTKHYQDYVAVVDSSILCWIIYHGPLWEDKPLLWLQLITGIDYTKEELSLIGERIWNLERLFNLSAGLSSKDDSLPVRMLTEPIHKGPIHKGGVVDLAPMLAEYYKLRGWDKNGVPKSEKLKQLGLAQQEAEVA
jgi:aldehyde:ferredoxin oxidoreductase